MRFLDLILIIWFYFNPILSGLMTSDQSCFNPKIYNILSAIILCSLIRLDPLTWFLIPFYCVLSNRIMYCSTQILWHFILCHHYDYVHPAILFRSLFVYISLASLSYWTPAQNHACMGTYMCENQLYQLKPHFNQHEKNEFGLIGLSATLQNGR